jgi:hypothetical protein
MKRLNKHDRSLLSSTMARFSIISIGVLCMLFPGLVRAGEDRLDKKPGVDIIPLFQYNFLSLEKQQIRSFSGGGVLQSEDVQCVGLYSRHEIRQPLLYEYPEVLHSVDLLLDGTHGRHQYIAIFKSESDRPVVGGLQTFQSALVYGYEFRPGRGWSIAAGGGLAVSDFGIDGPDGDPWPVIPVPLLRINYSAEYLAAKFECLTSPNLDFTIGPKSPLRVTLNHGLTSCAMSVI